MTDSPDPELAWNLLPRAYGPVIAEGVIRQSPEDFRVDEILRFSPDGVGEHVMVHVEKRGVNTEQVTRSISKAWNVASRDIGYAGMKDRNAVTRQWFSVLMTGREDPAPGLLENDQISVLEMSRHGRKLRRGALVWNRFCIVVRDVAGDSSVVDERITQIAKQGMPNFFGDQRFGRQGSNIASAERLFTDPGFRASRHKRGLYLSAARSYLFNRVLALRIERGDWSSQLAGDLMMLDGKNALFVPDEDDLEIPRRLGLLDIHPTGPLWGKDRQHVTAAVAELESSIIDRYPVWRDGLERFGLSHDRRALRVRVDNLIGNWLEAGVLELSFGLPSGCFATTLLREIFDFSGKRSQPVSHASSAE